MKTIVESVPEYRRLFDDSSVGAIGSADASFETLEDKMFEYEVERTYFDDILPSFRQYQILTRQ